MSTSTSAAALPLRGGLIGPRGTLWLQASILLAFLAASSVPSPLYALYREAWHFSAFMLTLVFGVYALALLAALLVFGRLSDHLGRRPVVLLSLLLQAGSVLLFHQARGVGWLLAARLLQGVATGIATATVSAGLIDLHRERGALLNGIAPLLGMAVGVLSTSALVQYGGDAMHEPYAALLAVFALQFAAVCCMSETVSPRAGAWRSLRPQLALPAAARPVLAGVLPLNTALWAMGAFFFSLGPTLARQVNGQASALLSGMLPALPVLGAVAAILVVRQRPAPGVLRSAALWLAGGQAVVLLGVQQHATAALFGGALLAGVGFGAAFNASLRLLAAAASDPHERAGLMASFYVLSYLAFSLPALGAGWLAGHWSLERTSLLYGAVLIVLALLAWLGMRRPLRRG